MFKRMDVKRRGRECEEQEWEHQGRRISERRELGKGQKKKEPQLKKLRGRSRG